MTTTDATGTAAYLMVIVEALEAQGVSFPEAVLQAVNDARRDRQAPRIDQPAVMAFGTFVMAECRKREMTRDEAVRLLDEIGAILFSIW